MNRTTHTTAGTAVFEPNRAEYEKYLDNRVRQAVGMSADEFRRAYDARELDETDAQVSHLIALLELRRKSD